MTKHLSLLAGVCALVLALTPSGPALAAECPRPRWQSSPPPIAPTVTGGAASVTVAFGAAWIGLPGPTGSMRPAIHDGSKVVVVAPQLEWVVPGRAIVFAQQSQLWVHRVYYQGIDSKVPEMLLGAGESGWTLAWDGQWHEPGVTPPDPPLSLRYWLTQGDNNCFADPWKVRYAMSSAWWRE